MMFLTGVSTRSLSIISTMLIGWKIFPTRVGVPLAGVFQRFEAKGFGWQHDLPSAVKCLERSIGACLTFFICPEEAWISLRTTNIIERLNKELKRRTKPMEIVAGENACYTLLAFICLKMELHCGDQAL